MSTRDLLQQLELENHVNCVSRIINEQNKFETVSPNRNNKCGSKCKTTTQTDNFLVQNSKLHTHKQVQICRDNYWLLVGVRIHRQYDEGSLKQGDGKDHQSKIVIIPGNESKTFALEPGNINSGFQKTEINYYDKLKIKTGNFENIKENAFQKSEEDACEAPSSKTTIGTDAIPDIG
ncbi:hypothetical protein CEXT_681581 [Caerostris extrusa]|uniref:Uncharacterized protein n=1 Tax=Caerostris extrusa TaxID=172846 RepID=A0AAV4NHT5_CAEEX|nr:hypothetical protein CEXT_681581 [Caerostris extrusa]